MVLFSKKGEILISENILMSTDVPISNLKTSTIY